MKHQLKKPPSNYVLIVSTCKNKSIILYPYTYSGPESLGSGSSLRVFRDSMNPPQTLNQLQSLYLAVWHLQDFRNTFTSVYCRLVHFVPHSHVTTINSRSRSSFRVENNQTRCRQKQNISSVTAWGQRHEPSLKVYWLNWDGGADWSDLNPLSVSWRRPPMIRCELTHREIGL